MAARARMTASQRREQLVGVARGVFAERGYAGATIAEIAERAGVTKPVIYQHFGGKEGLYAVVVGREIDTLTGRITTALRAEHPREATEQAADAFLGYIEEHESGFRVLVRDAPAGTTSSAMASVIGEVATQAEQVLAEELTLRGFDPAHAPIYGQMLVGAVAVLGEWWLDVRDPPREEVAAHVVNLVWNGLKDLQRDPLSVAA